MRPVACPPYIAPARAPVSEPGGGQGVDDVRARQRDSRRRPRVRNRRGGRQHLRVVAAARGCRDIAGRDAGRSRHLEPRVRRGAAGHRPRLADRPRRSEIRRDLRSHPCLADIHPVLDRPRSPGHARSARGARGRADRGAGAARRTGQPRSGTAPAGRDRGPTAGRGGRRPGLLGAPGVHRRPAVAGDGPVHRLAAAAIPGVLAAGGRVGGGRCPAVGRQPVVHLLGRAVRPGGPHPGGVHGDRPDPGLGTVRAAAPAPRATRPPTGRRADDRRGAGARCVRPPERRQPGRPRRPRRTARAAARPPRR